MLGCGPLIATDPPDPMVESEEVLVQLAITVQSPVMAEVVYVVVPDPPHVPVHDVK
jgi:hypothetical protein